MKVEGGSRNVEVEIPQNCIYLRTMSHYKLFQSICCQLFWPVEGEDAVLDPMNPFKGDSDQPAKIARRLNAAFLMLLAGQKHPDYKMAQALLHQTS